MSLASMSNQPSQSSTISQSNGNIYSNYERNRPPPPIAPIPIPQPNEINDYSSVKRSTSNGSMLNKPVTRSRTISNRVRPLTMADYGNQNQFLPKQHQPDYVPDNQQSQSVVRSPSSPAMNSRQRSRANPLDVGTTSPVQIDQLNLNNYPLPQLPQASAHKRSHSLSQKPEVQKQSPPTPSIPPMSTINEPIIDQQTTPSKGLARKFNSILHRQSSNNNDNVPTRQRVNSTNSYRNGMNRASMFSKMPISKNNNNYAQIEAQNKLEGNNNQQQSPISNHRRAYTVIDKKRGENNNNKESNHDRNFSTGTSKLSHTVGRNSGVGPWIQAANKNEEYDQEQSKMFDNRNLSDEVFDPVEEPKAVWGKGLFSVATTSTKSSSTLREEISSTLVKLGVNYRLTRSGFECLHQPSISVGGAGSKRLESSGDYKDLKFSDSSEHMKFGKYVKKKSSKLSFNSLKSSNHQNNNSHEFSNDQSLSTSKVRFEVNIVRVPWLLGINGIQFRRIAGNSWSYKAVAQRVLGELQL